MQSHKSFSFNKHKLNTSFHKSHKHILVLHYSFRQEHESFPWLDYCDNLIIISIFRDLIDSFLLLKPLIQLHWLVYYIAMWFAHPMVALTQYVHIISYLIYRNMTNGLFTINHTIQSNIHNLPLKSLKLFLINIKT